MEREGETEEKKKKKKVNLRAEKGGFQTSFRE